MTLELLIHAIVRQTTVLIAQLATARGVRAPLAQIADQVFAELVLELERQGVSRKVSADMFGLGLRTYRRKVQRLSESSTDRGRSLWEAVLEHIRHSGLVSKRDLLQRFRADDEVTVKSVLHDLCESQLVFSSGSGAMMSYRAASDEEARVLQMARGSEGEDELVAALMYREGALSLREIAKSSQAEPSSIEASLTRLLEAGRIESEEDNGERRYKARALVIPLGAAHGWEGAVFDHFKALVTTVLCRLRANRPSTAEDEVGGSTYTLDVWEGHPMAAEVFGTLGRMRAALTELRSKVSEHNLTQDLPDAHRRVVIYVGQSVVDEGLDSAD